MDLVPHFLAPTGEAVTAYWVVGGEEKRTTEYDASKVPTKPQREMEGTTHTFWAVTQDAGASAPCCRPRQCDRSIRKGRLEGDGWEEFRPFGAYVCVCVCLAKIH